MDVEKLSISLPADMAEMIRSHVRSGSYASNSEVIRDALRLWQQRESERASRLASIRDRIDQAANNPERLSDADLARHFDDRLAEAEKKRAR